MLLNVIFALQVRNLNGTGHGKISTALGFTEYQFLSWAASDTHDKT